MQRGLGLWPALLLALISISGCRAPGSIGQSAANSAIASASPTAAGARQLRYAVVSLTRPSGHSHTTIASDGTATTDYLYHENGRGPELTLSYRLQADGTLAWYQVRGRDEMGIAVDEHFAIEQGQARWQSSSERGAQALERPAFYLPLNSSCEIDGLLARALERAGGALPLLPAGEARSQPAGEFTITVSGTARHLRGVSISGLDFVPSLVWLDDDGTYFGTVDSWYACVPEGWQSAIDALIAEGKRLNAARDVRLAQQLAQRPPAAGLAIAHARVFDAASRRWLDDQTVLVQGERISALGPAATTRIPAGAQVIDGTGKSLLPGLWDAHVHLSQADGLLDIASGVTTVRDVGNDPDLADDLKQRFDSGAAIGPHVLRHGVVEGRGPDAASWTITAMTEAEARAAVDFYVERGYDGMKIYNSTPVALVPLIAQLAHAHGMRVDGHVPFGMRAEECVRAGYDEVTHVNMIYLDFLAGPDVDTRTTARFTVVAAGAAGLDLQSKPVQDFIALLKSRHAAIDPTVGVFERLFTSRTGAIPPGWQSIASRLPVQVRRSFLTGGLPIPDGMDQRYNDSAAALPKLVRAFHDAGIPVLIGTDDWAGVTMARELELYVQGGIPSAEVLALATLGAAQLLGQDRISGSIAAGKRADLVLVDGDPIARISDVGRVVSVVKNGVVFDSAALCRAVGVRPWQEHP